MKVIKNWKELAQLEPSATHRLDIDVRGCNGWIEPLDEKKRDNFEDTHYLSTHTFYLSNYKKSTEILQKCGFDVVLEGWLE